MKSLLTLTLALLFTASSAHAESCLPGTLYVYETGTNAAGIQHLGRPDHYYCPATGEVGIALSTTLGWIRPTGLRPSDHKEIPMDSGRKFPRCQVTLMTGDLLPLSLFNEKPCQYGPVGFVPNRRGICFDHNLGWAAVNTCSTQ